MYALINLNIGKIDRNLFSIDWTQCYTLMNLRVYKCSNSFKLNEACQTFNLTGIMCVFVCMGITPVHCDVYLKCFWHYQIIFIAFDAYQNVHKIYTQIALQSTTRIFNVHWSQSMQFIRHLQCNCELHFFCVAFRRSLNEMAGKRVKKGHRDGKSEGKRQRKIDSAMRKEKIWQ